MLHIVFYYFLFEKYEKIYRSNYHSRARWISVQIAISGTLDFGTVVGFPGTLDFGTDQNLYRNPGCSKTEV